MHSGFKSLVVLALVALLGPVLAAPAEVTSQNEFANTEVVKDSALQEKWFNSIGYPGTTGGSVVFDPVLHNYFYGRYQIVNWRDQYCALHYNRCYPLSSNFYPSNFNPSYVPRLAHNYFDVFSTSPVTTYNGYSIFNRDNQYYWRGPGGTAGVLDYNAFSNFRDAPYFRNGGVVTKK